MEGNEENRKEHRRIVFIVLEQEKKNPPSRIVGFFDLTCFTGGYQILVDSIKYDNLYQLE